MGGLDRSSKTVLLQYALASRMDRLTFGVFVRSETSQRTHAAGLRSKAASRLPRIAGTARGDGLHEGHLGTRRHGPTSNSTSPSSARRRASAQRTAGCHGRMGPRQLRDTSQVKMSKTRMFLPLSVQSVSTCFYLIALEEDS